MALSANAIIERKQQPVRARLKVVDGLIHIYKGALLQYEEGNVGYVEPAATDIAIGVQPTFAGIANDELNKTAAQNASDGDFEIEVIPRGTGEWVKLATTATITIANEGAAVYMDGDGTVDIAANISNSTGGKVGVIRQFISANLAWVELTDN